MGHLEQALNTIQDTDKPVGIMVSGGLDSSLLLFMLLRKHKGKGKVHVFSSSLGQRGDTDIKHCLEVVKKCCELTRNYNVEHHITYAREIMGPVMFRLAEEYVNDGRIAFLYTGITKNPPTEIQEKWTFENPNWMSAQANWVATKRDPNEVQDPFEHIEAKKIYPWTNLHKQDIAELYKRNNLLETLFPLTKSCTDFTVGDTHCGDCWWCKEREWGFGRL